MTYSRNTQLQLADSCQHNAAAAGVRRVVCVRRRAVHGPGWVQGVQLKRCHEGRLDSFDHLFTAVQWCKVHIQMYDRDTVGKNDFLGEYEHQFVPGSPRHPASHLASQPQVEASWGECLALHYVPPHLFLFIGSPRPPLDSKLREQVGARSISAGCSMWITRRSRAGRAGQPRR